VALATFTRLSLQKAAHANLADAEYRKSGSHRRTWADNDFFKCFHSMVTRILPFSDNLLGPFDHRSQSCFSRSR
jgi:hypothetical protein